MQLMVPQILRCRVVRWAAAATLLAVVALADDAAASAADEANDPTKELLSRLTIGMVSEVLDERTVAVRDNTSTRIVLRLGNVERPERASLTEVEYEAKLNASKTALSALVAKQMIWWKAAPVEAGGSEAVLSDLWTIDGRHINGALRKQGHLVEASHYEEELARDILTAEAEHHKSKQYELLKEALEEDARAKATAAAKEAKAAEEKAEPIGMSGWLGIATLVIIVVGAMTNFGRGYKKKNNPNRKKNFFERCWSRLKVA